MWCYRLLMGLAVPAVVLLLPGECRLLSEELPLPPPLSVTPSLDPPQEELVPIELMAPEPEPVLDAEVVTERYPNRAVKIERHVVQDEDRNYVNHGPWKMQDPRGRVTAQGAYRFGKRHGTWMRLLDRFAAADGQFQPPFLSQAEFVDGQLHGAWTVSDSRHRLVGTWQFDNDKLHGTASTWYANGQPCREMEFVHGVLDGEAITWTPAGAVSRRDYFRNGTQLVHSVTWHDQKQKKTEGWLQYPDARVRTRVDWWKGVLEIAGEPAAGEAIRVGEWTEWYPNGTVRFQGSFKHGKPDGEHTWWHENGQKLLSGVYEAGLQERLWTRWHANGKKHEEGIYLAGNRQGEWTRWTTEGLVAEVKQMSRGQETLDVELSPTQNVSLEPAD